MSETYRPQANAEAVAHLRVVNRGETPTGESVKTEVEAEENLDARIEALRAQTSDQAA